MSPADRDRLAAEHVLGTLEHEERREAERLAEKDGAFQASVRDWRARFAELDETAPPQPADEMFWRRIERGIDEAYAAPSPAAAAPARAAAAPPALLMPSPASAFTALWRNLAFWRFAGLATAAATLVLALALTVFDDNDRPIHVAVLLTDDNRPQAVVHAFDDGTAELIPLQDIPVPRDRALQVWTLWDRARGPVSVGLMDRARTIRLRVEDLPRTGANQLFEITVEPPAGSPTGRPTGPVLSKGLAAPALPEL